uniref:Uncharacterized protein n=1 Tax=Methanococcus maripaludis (strain C6 / ATCC BAA-1332) TaxID=444158 RepID=A9AAA9_METM6
MYTESEVFEKLISKAESESLDSKVFSIYNKIKNLLPVEYRNKYTFCLTKEEYLVVNITNYRVFAIYVEKKEFIIEICYPTEKIADLIPEILEKMPEKEDEIYNFNVAPCSAVCFKINQILKFSDLEWDYFVEAVHSLAKAKKSRLRDHNVDIIWNRDAELDSNSISMDRIKSEFKKLNESLKDKTPDLKKKTVRIIERRVIGKKVKVLNDYRCQICDALGLKQNSFLMKNSNNYYVETHHVIPVKELKPGTLAI